MIILYGLVRFNKIGFVSTAERIESCYTFDILWNSIPVGREAIRRQQFTVFRFRVRRIIPKWIIRISTKKCR